MPSFYITTYNNDFVADKNASLKIIKVFYNVVILIKNLIIRKQ